MSWSLIDKPKTVRVTTAIAKEWMGLPCIPHDRPLSERRLEIYKKLLAEGKFRPVTWAKCLCEEDNVVYRINGKHTSTMLAGMNGDLPEFFATVESYGCEKIEDLPQLYATFDSKTQSRNPSDINRTFAASNPDLVDLPSKTVNVVVSGLGYAKWQDGSYGKQSAERAELILENVEFALWFRETAVMGRPAMLYRGPVAAAMYLTWSKSKKDATTFWESVQHETGTTPDCPDRVLAKWLLLCSVNAGKGAERSPSRKAEPREFFVKSILAWNAFRKNEKTTLRYYPDAALPKVL